MLFKDVGLRGDEKLPDPELNFAFELKGNENKKESYI